MDLISCWIDDLRDPSHYLKEEQLKNLVWLKTIQEAIFYVQNNAQKIETLYLDHYMDHNSLFGSEIVYMVNYDGKSVFPNLKTIYLHTSDDNVIEELMFIKEEFEKMDIQLLEANY